MPPPTPDREYFLILLAEAFEKQAWHGPNLKGALRGIGARQAGWRPAPGRHSIWELTVHAAYWKYAVRRRLTGEKRGSFPLKGSNWFARPEDGGEAEWKQDLQLLNEQHRLLFETVEGLAPDAITARAARLIRGAAMHDLYHAGQISLLKRLAVASTASGGRGSS